MNSTNESTLKTDINSETSVIESQPPIAGGGNYANSGITFSANSSMDLRTLSWGIPPKEKLQPK